MPSVNLARGMRDLLPAELNPRLAVLDTVREVFLRFGFEPLETPAMERIETLTGKYGEEGERLMYKVLKRGEAGKRGEVDLGLRYDLTVPLARVVAMHPELALPFKRHQIQPVWRAERPQRGRYREFWQCDIDVVGTTDSLAEAECLAVADAALAALGFQGVRFKLNDRRWLTALAEQLGAADQATPLLMSLDKLDKIGRDGVATDMVGRGFTAEQAARLWDLLDGGLDGVAEIEQGLAHIVDMAQALGVPEGRITVDPTLARGLDYYTGPVFEAVLEDPRLEGRGVGSIAGGGRYDGLIGMFSGRQIPAVGVSLGLDRLMVLLDELGALPGARTAARVWVTVFSPEQRPASLAAAAAFRRGGVPTAMSFGQQKLGKQLKAAANRGVAYAVVIGPDEAAAGKVNLRDLGTGEQRLLALDAAVDAVTPG